MAHREQQKVSAALVQEIILNMTRTTDIVPVVYVSFGLPGKYFLYGVEQTQRTNDLVIFICDSFQSYWRAPRHGSQGEVIYVPLNSFEDGLSELKSRYVPVGLKDRQEYEWDCIARWFVVRNVAQHFEMKRLFYADSDTVVHYNITEAANLRRDCAAVLVCEGIPKQFPMGSYYLYANGQSSIWQTSALEDFCEFVLMLHSPQYIGAVTLKGIAHGGMYPHRVVDMTLLWIWWMAKTSDKPVGSWETGRSYGDSFNVELFDMAVERQCYVAEHFSALSSYVQWSGCGQ
jgi:hypothetical protein